MGVGRIVDAALAGSNDDYCLQRCGVYVLRLEAFGSKKMGLTRYFVRLYDTAVPVHSISHAYELRTPSPYELQVWRRRQLSAASRSPWAR
eukprot:5283916-Pleurochrysis_carterae.AAC.1